MSRWNGRETLRDYELPRGAWKEGVSGIKSRRVPPPPRGNGRKEGTVLFSGESLKSRLR